MFLDMSPLDLLALRTVRAFADGARNEVRAELGPELKELAEIRSALDPRAELSEVAAAVNGDPDAT